MWIGLFLGTCQIANALIDADYSSKVSLSEVIFIFDPEASYRSEFG
jgi:hypothetical protein